MRTRPYTYKPDFAEHIKKSRAGQRISQGQLADLCGVSRQTVARWESGGRKPSLNALVKISEVLQIPVLELISVKEGEDSVFGELAPSAAEECAYAADREPQDAVGGQSGYSAPDGSVDASESEAWGKMWQAEGTGCLPADDPRSEPLVGEIPAGTEEGKPFALIVAMISETILFFVLLSLSVMSGIVAFSDIWGDVAIKAGIFSLDFFVGMLTLAGICFVCMVITGIFLFKTRKKGGKGEGHQGERQIAASDADYVTTAIG